MNKIFTLFRESNTGKFFIPFGLILIIFSVFTFISVNNIKNYIKTEAVVTRTELYEQAHYDVDDTYHEATYKVYVRYTVNERRYEEEYGIFSGYKVGDEITICYNPENPKEIAQPNTILLPIIILTLGIVSLITGIISIIKTSKKIKEKNANA